MTSSRTDMLKIFAPAKINLYLHVTGRRDDGYHELDSLAVFADIGDQITIEPANDFSLTIQGPYSPAFTAKEKDASPNSNNLAARAVWALSLAAHRKPDVHVTLIKNLPLGSGIGGGSSDAAAVLWGLMEWWGLSSKAPYMPGIMADLGADVPACLTCEAVRMLGTGDILEPAPSMPEIPVLLVYPGRPCSTADVYRLFSGEFRPQVLLPESFDTAQALAAFLKDQHNDLTEPALNVMPDIAGAIDVLGKQPGVLLARMSGSGSTVFGLFPDEESCLKAAENIIGEHPDWWVRAGHINRPERY